MTALGQVGKGIANLFGPGVFEDETLKKFLARAIQTILCEDALTKWTKQRDTAKETTQKEQGHGNYITLSAFCPMEKVMWKALQEVTLSRYPFLKFLISTYYLTHTNGHIIVYIST